MRQAQILHAVLQKQTPAFPDMLTEGREKRLYDLCVRMSTSCWSFDPSERPSMKYLVQRCIGENWDLRKGGFHPVRSGDTFSDGRYTAVRELDSSHFPHVWLALDKRFNSHVALKIVNSAPRYTASALDEIKLLQRIISSDGAHPGRAHVIGFLDHFRHRGPNGNHVCMVFEVLGEDLLPLMRLYRNMGVPLHLVKQITKQVLLGLDYMHRACGMMLTDLKPEGILICSDDVKNIIQSELASVASGRNAPTKIVRVLPSKGTGDRISVKIANLGSATWIEHLFTRDIQTRQDRYRCPEVIIGDKLGPSTDIWSVACLAFELITGGDYLFNTASGKRHSEDEDHIAHILHNRYVLPKEHADAMSAFLAPMLRLNADERPSASELVHHTWLDGIVVQGEEQLIRQAEEAERRRRTTTAQAQGVNVEGRARRIKEEEEEEEKTTRRPARSAWRRRKQALGFDLT